MGLAHFLRTRREEAAAKDANRTIVGTDDYLAPEQIVDSNDVDIRADVYSLGATFYFLLTGKAPFQDVEMGYHKLLRHLAQRPKPIRELRPDLPEGLAALINRMMEQNPWGRFQTPAQVIDALVEWTKTPIPPPPETKIPKLSPAARLSGMHLANGAAARSSPTGSSWVLPKETRGST